MDANMKEYYRSCFGDEFINLDAKSAIKINLEETLEKVKNVSSSDRKLSIVNQFLNETSKVCESDSEYWKFVSPTSFMKHKKND